MLSGLEYINRKYEAWDYLYWVKNSLLLNRETGKGKVVTARREGTWGCGNSPIALFVLNLATRWKWVASFTLQPLYLRGKKPQFQSNIKLGETQNRSGPFSHHPTAFMIILNYITLGRIPLDEWSVCRRDLWQNTTLTTDIHAPGQIRNHYPRKQAAADTLLIPRSHWDRIWKL